MLLANRYDNGVGQDGLSQYISDMGMFAHYNDVDDIPAEGIEGRLSIENDKLVFVPV